MIGKPWKPPQADPPRPPRPAPSADERPASALGLPYWWIAVVTIVILVAAGAAAYHAWRELEERQRIVSEERERFAEYLAEREAAFAALTPLTQRNQQLLRRSLNAQHVATAQRLGIDPIPTRDDVSERVQSEGLLRLGGSPNYWLARMSYSVPYVTADGAAVIDSIAARFHDRLAALDLPPFQFNITSVLRTRQDQARLRGVNINAARGASSHEFGTTFDLHYRRFRYAADPRIEVETALGPLPYAFLYDEFARELRGLYERMADEHVTRIGAELGRALIDLENSGKLLAIREIRQPVYHITVARRLAS